MTTRPLAASAQAHIIIRTAFDEFNNIVSNDEKHIFNDTTLQDVRVEALQIERGLRERRLQKNMLRLEPFLKGLERYSKVMDVLCNGTPFLPWVWAPLKLILLTALDVLNAFEKLVEAYGKVAHVLPRLERFSAAFNYDVSFQNVLALVYADILDIHRNSYALVRKRSWKILFGSTWARFETRFGGILQRLAYHSDLLDREAYAINISETLSHNNEELLRWERQDTELEAFKRHRVFSWLRMDESSPEHTLSKHCDDSLPTSCDWFMNQDKMQLWQNDGSENALVWITGKPGAGKSVLCSNIIQRTQSSGLEVLYYFCSYLGDSTDRCSRLLRSLAYQIIQKRQDLATYVYDNYTSHRPDEKIMIELLQQLLPELGSTRIVIDGVDEWNAHQHELLTHLKKLIRTDASLKICKILISSRDTLEFSRNLAKRNKTIAFSNLSDRQESIAIKHSISCFVEARLNDLPSHFDDLDPEGLITARIKRKLIEMSNGMFLWVRLVLDSFNSIYSPEDLSNIVDNLPSDLNSLYAQIFRGLCSIEGPQSYGGVPRIISWICHAQRPLHKYELTHAISIGSIHERANNQSIPVVNILDHCKPLIEFRQDGTVVFVHFSVKEFFLACAAPGIIPSLQAQLDIASASVGLLVKGLKLLMPTVGQADVLVKIAGGSYRLLTYALEFWIEHCLLYVTSVGYSGVQEVLSERMARLQEEHDYMVRRLHHTVHQRHADALPSETEVDQRVDLYTDRPAQTIMRDHLLTRKLVSLKHCENGKDAESSMEQHDPTLLSKLAIEFEDIRVHLLSHSTVENVSPSYLSSFQKSYASITLRCRFPNCLWAPEGFSSEQLRIRHESCHVQRIYCKMESCQYHRTGFTTRTAHDKHVRNFHQATLAVIVPPKIRRVGKAQDIRLALRTKNDSPEQNHNPPQRLSSTAVKSKTRDAGAEERADMSPTYTVPEKTDRLGATRLAREAEKGDLDGVKAAYAIAPDELDLHDYTGITPLQKAAIHGWDDIVAFLLGEGCRTDCMSIDRDTPLIGATENSYLHVIKLLLSKGVDPHHQNNKGQRAIDVLHWNDEEADEIFVELKRAMRRHRQPSEDAASSPQSQFRSPSRLHLDDYSVETLIEKCSDGDVLAVRELINSDIKPSITCGIAAARGGHHDILRILLANGLPSNLDPARNSGTPMTAAIGRGHINVINLLLEQDGFDPTIRNRKGQKYYEIAEERQGLRWEEERTILKQANDNYEVHRRSAMEEPDSAALHARHKRSPLPRSGSKKLRRLKTSTNVKRRKRVLSDRLSTDESDDEVRPPMRKARRQLASQLEVKAELDFDVDTFMAESGFNVDAESDVDVDPFMF
ncbi:hypothetical protein BKA63DRAFT_112495 [Paraphoma chrysanthemicola]|nr:hypothetical protein BKA63DRAFT_112495 [Paraphoma chrysanthemicola]